MTQSPSRQLNRILEQREALTPQQQQQVLDFIEFLHYKAQKAEYKAQETPSLNQTLLNKWQHLCEKGQELDPENPLTESEITQIRHLLHSTNQSCPVGLAQGEFTVPDNFNDPLPDDILASFYPQ